jgi:FMN phosphatase YigB (HAD superfamily)
LVIRLKSTILFDLGGTLAHYYDRSEFPFILEQAIREVQFYLDEKSLLTAAPELIRSRVSEEDHESADYRSRPLRSD